MDNTIEIVEMPDLGLGWVPGQYAAEYLVEKQTDNLLKEWGPWLAVGVGVLVVGAGVGLWLWGR